MFGKNNEPTEDCIFVTIFDVKSKSYRDPVQAKDLPEIIRVLETNFRKPELQFDQYVTHPEDFQLFKLGSFDRKTGLITSHQPEHIVNLHELRPRPGHGALSAT